MVREANVKRAAAEKQLKEAQGKVGGAFLAPVPPSLNHVLSSSPVTPRSMSFKLK